MILICELLISVLDYYVCKHNTLSLRSVLEKDKLSGSNFLDWQRNLRIVLRQERKLYVLDGPVPEQPPLSATPRVDRDAYQKHLNDAVDVRCLMLALMTFELQKQHEAMDAFDMIEHLKLLFQGQARCNIPKFPPVN